LPDVEEEAPVPMALPGIKAEPDVSCVSGSMVGGLYKYRYSLYYELLLD
jgi:hypothetical protein